MPNGVSRGLTRFPTSCSRFLRSVGKAYRVSPSRFSRGLTGRFNIGNSRGLRGFVVNGFLSGVGDGALIRGTRHVSRKAVSHFHCVSSYFFLDFCAFGFRRFVRSNHSDICNSPIRVVSLTSKWGHGQGLIHLYDYRSGRGVEQ